MRTEKGNTEAENVLCPLFRAYTTNAIRCESHVPDSTTIEIRYQDPKKCDLQRKLYCEGNWKRCEQFLSWKHMRWEE